MIWIEVLYMYYAEQEYGAVPENFGSQRYLVKALIGGSRFETKW